MENKRVVKLAKVHKRKPFNWFWVGLGIGIFIPIYLKFVIKKFMKPTIDQVIKGMEKIKAVVFKEPNSINLFGVRTNENTADTFNDWGGAFYWDEQGKRHELIIPITTDAGVYYRLKPMNKLGTAILVHDKQYRGCYHLLDNGHMGKKHFDKLNRCGIGGITIRIQVWKQAERFTTK